jgi:hypothetical protein
MNPYPRSVMVIWYEKGQYRTRTFTLLDRLGNTRGGDEVGRPTHSVEAIRGRCDHFLGNNHGGVIHNLTTITLAVDGGRRAS